VHLLLNKNIVMKECCCPKITVPLVYKLCQLLLVSEYKNLLKYIHKTRKKCLIKNYMLYYCQLCNIPFSNDFILLYRYFFFFPVDRTAGIVLINTDREPAHRILYIVYIYIYLGLGAHIPPRSI